MGSGWSPGYFLPIQLLVSLPGKASEDSPNALTPAPVWKTWMAPVSWVLPDTSLVLWPLVEYSSRWKISLTLSLLFFSIFNEGDTTCSCVCTYIILVEKRLGRHPRFCVLGKSIFLERQQLSFFPVTDTARKILEGPRTPQVSTLL